RGREDCRDVERPRPTRDAAATRLHSRAGPNVTMSARTTQLHARNGEVDLVASEWPGRTPDAPLLVALHGMGLRGEVWAGLAELVADSHRVLAPDIRGHGDSDKPDSGYSLADLTEDLRAWFERLGAERATLVAHSYGARVALNFAALF